MKRLLLAIGTSAALLLAVEIAAYAAGTKAAGKYTGCLKQGDGPNEFMLTNVNGGTDAYELVGGKGLKDHVGHKVEITGKPITAKSASKAEKEPSSGEKSETESGHQHLRVTSMRHIAETCP